MIVHAILYFISFALVFSYNVFDNGYAPFVVDAVFVAMSLISLITVLIIRHNLFVVLDNSKLTGVRDETEVVDLVIKNKGLLPATYVRTRVNCEYADGRTKHFRLNALCNGHSDSKLNFKLSDNKCENIRICIKRIYVYDYIHFFCFSKKVKIEENFTVLPKLPDSDVISKMAFDMNGDNDNLYSSTKAGDDNTEIFNIREYAPGDKIRNIHWKMTSKIGELMVKDYGLPIFEQDTVIVDFEEKIISNEEYDLLNGLMFTMLQRGFGFKLFYKDNGLIEKNIDNQEKIIDFYNDFYEKDLSVKLPSAAELYYELHEGDKHRIFYVFDELSEKYINRIKLLQHIGPVYYLCPINKGGGEYLIKY